MAELSREIDRLIAYGLANHLLENEDVFYTRNRLLKLFREDEYIEEGIENEGIEDEGVEDELPKEFGDLEDILKNLLDIAVSRGLTEDSVTFRDLFDTEIMNLLLPRPSEVSRTFREKYKSSPKEATDYYYDLSRASDYIRTYRVKKDLRWKVDSVYGKIDISINLSKPEKDPKAIAAAGKAKSSGYPKCLLCAENEGYAGRVNHPGRANHRIIPLTVNGTEWGLQYSPYVYYNEHCILLNKNHVPMKIEKDTFRKLLDFVRQFPHYIMGSNADLPIVGGSILSHDHYQGGCYSFPMAEAPMESEVVIPGYEDVEAGIVRWPLSVIRIRSKKTLRLVDLADHILSCWRPYSDPSVDVLAETAGVPHNTITPIARCRDGVFELDLTLRNNRTTEERPLGLFHPAPERHHIKKENIGLIEVMGLAILPARLKQEIFEELREALLSGGDLHATPTLDSHSAWAGELRAKYGAFDEKTIDSILMQEVGEVFTGVLEDAGVFKRDPAGKEAFLRFARTL